jgi:amino acid transporter
MMLGFMVWSSYWIPTNMLVSTRYVFAWAFDRVFPAKLADVHPRFNTPVTAIIVAAAVALISLVIQTLLPQVATLSGMAGINGEVLVVCLAAVAYPFVRRASFEDSPVNQRIAGVPLMSIVALVATIFVGYIEYLFLTDEVAAVQGIGSLIAVAIPIIVGFVSFFVIRALRRREGIDVDLAFGEIPVE